MFPGGGLFQEGAGYKTAQGLQKVPLGKQKEKVSTVDTFANHILRRWGLERTAQVLPH